MKRHIVSLGLISSFAMMLACGGRVVRLESTADAPTNYGVVEVFTLDEARACLAVDSYIWLSDGDQLVLTAGEECMVDEDGRVLVTWSGSTRLWSDALGWRDCTADERSIFDFDYCPTE